MRVLLDTNLLTRSVDPKHPHHPVARAAMETLVRRGDDLCVVPQTIYEFWVVCTRPRAVNGLEMTAATARAEVEKITALFTFIPDTPEVYTQWLTLVSTLNVQGKPAHDARLVAAMLAHGIPQLLTFNDKDFRRFPAVQVSTPQ